MVRNKACRGSVTVEAAIILPLFIIAVLSVGFIMKLHLAQSYMQHVLSDEVGQIAEEVYVKDQVISNDKIAEAFNVHGLLSQHTQSALSEKINQRITKKKLQQLHIKGEPSIIRYQYLFDGRYEKEHRFIKADDLIEVVTVCRADIPFPLKFRKNIFLVQTVLERAWTGTTKVRDPMDFNQMSKSTQGQTVYIFPKSGQRYHNKQCIFINNYPSQQILTDEIKQKYSPCHFCSAEKLSNGATVFIFEESGKVFHSKDCPLVNKYVVPITKDKAIQKGYTPCKKCIK